MRKNLLTGLTIAFSIFVFFASTQAETITKPHTFTDGTPALASEVNANFDTVYDQVNKVGTEVHIDSTNHRVGIGTQNPGAKLTVAGEGELIANAVVAYGDTSDVIPVFVGARARGTHSAPTAVQQGDLLTLFVSKGHMGTGFTYWSNAGIIIKAAENFSETNQGTKINFLTTPNGAINKQTRMTIDHNGKVGIGTTSPASTLEIASDSAEANSIAMLSVTTYDDSASTSPAVVTGRRARGTKASPSRVLSGDFLASMGSRGYGDTGFGGYTAATQFEATEDFTDSTKGTAMLFRTSLNGTTSPTERMRIDHNGNVGIGTTTPQSALQVNGYTQLALTSGSPPAVDCNEVTERGRMKVDDTAGLLYICVASGWVSK